MLQILLFFWFVPIDFFANIIYFRGFFFCIYCSVFVIALIKFIFVFVTNLCHKSPLIFMTEYYAMIRGLFIKWWDAFVWWDIELDECLSLVWSWIRDMPFCGLFFGKTFYIFTNIMLCFPCVKSFQIKWKKCCVVCILLSVIYWHAREL